MRQNRFDVFAPFKGSAEDQICRGPGGIEAEFLKVIIGHELRTFEYAFVWWNARMNVYDSLSLIQFVEQFIKHAVA